MLFPHFLSAVSIFSSVHGVKPDPVADLTLTTATSSSLQVSWSKYDCAILPNDFISYRYYLNGKFTDRNTTLTTSGYTFLNLEPLKTYELKVEFAVYGENTAEQVISACTGQYLFCHVTVLFDRVYGRVC